MIHTCTSLVLHCIDFRFGSAIKNYLESNNLLGDCDIVAVGGATKNIADPVEPTDRAFVLRQFANSRRLHDTKEAILINHTDCGGYGGRSAFSSDEEERNRHISDMKKAKEIILQFLPDLAVKTVLAKISPSGEVNFEEVE
mgnify:FL=1